jgi:uncharacterized protein
LKRKLPVFYDCDKCPAYCCSYPRIGVSKRDIARLARHFSIGAAEAKRRFTKAGEDKGEIILRHQKDGIFGTVCRFLDTATRRCTVYEARPKVCRAFPGSVRCGYYDFLTFERRHQEDEEYVSTTWNG